MFPHVNYMALGTLSPLEARQFPEILIPEKSLEWV